ncbi:MAG: Fur family transcriptional regulator, ferric uptake regulator [Campylobacterota bacterium]|nr:Fur family transcriptional regulator, ferric uptake regulator [Campylobacterota bacterium]
MKKKVEYKNYLEKFKELLKENSLKFTNQREVILDAIFSHKGHFTPETLHRSIAKNHKEKIGIATIYRTLSLLENANMITSITFGVNGKMYEFGEKQHHDHIICDRCEKIIEFFDEDIEKLQDKIAKIHNFKTTNHIMQIHGTCEECQNKENDKKNV